MVVALSIACSVLGGCSCFSSSTCSPSNCTGCCDNANICHGGTSDNACGTGANRCDVCGGGQSCNGSCRSGGDGGSVGGAGDGGSVGGGSDGGGVVVVGGTDGGNLGDKTISGRMTYQRVGSDFTPGSTTATLNFAASTQKPLRNTEIQVIQGTTTIGLTSTDADGRYSVAYHPTGTTEVRLYVLARTTKPVIQVQDNTDGKATYAVYGVIGTKTTLDIDFPTGWAGTTFDESARFASPFAVLDTMYTSAQAFIAVRPNVIFPPLKVNWSPNNVPQTGDKAQGQIGTSHFNRTENEIYVLGKAGADIDEFDDHVIAHEWGHYFEANLSRSDSPGGRHGPGDILDPRIAFGEAWGNALSAMVLKNPIYFDCTWGNTGLRCFGWNSETEPVPSDDTTPSAFSESSVLRALYDVYDAPSGAEPYDGVSLGLGPIYDTMVGPEKTTDSVTTLASFITGLKAQPGVNATAVDTLLAHWNIGSIRSQFGVDDPLLSDMFTNALTLPFNGGIDLGGGNLPNTWQQNQYYVFVGTGGMLNIAASSQYDVAINVYESGKLVGTSDKNETGTETIALTSKKDAVYVLVLTGFGTITGDYNVAITIQ